MSTQRLKEIIVLTASYFRQTIDKPILEMYVQDLEDLPISDVIEAYTKYRRNPKNRTFPLPAQIREMIAPEMSLQAEAREVIDKIKIAVRDFGYMQGNATKDYLGAVGWAVVQGAGGWSRVCETDFVFNPGLIAQARTRAEDLIQYGVPKYEGPKLVTPEPKPSLDDRKDFSVMKLLEATRKPDPQFNFPSEEERKTQIAQMLSDYRRKAEGV